MKQPLVSVIVPNYNHAPYLQERLDSIIGQTYQNMEIIVLDDRSTDDSLSVIKRYSDKVSQVVVNEKNSGSPFVQWERGFSLAKGDLIWIAESDDTCQPDFLERMVAEFEQRPELAVAFCRSQRIDVDGNRLGEDGFDEPSVIEGRLFIKNYLSRYNYIVNASSAVFARKLLDEVDRSYTQFRGCGDWVFWAEVAKSGYVAYIDVPLNCFRQHGNNTTAQQTRTGKGEQEVAEVTKYLHRKGYIGWTALLRAQVVHVYSVKYGKLSGVVSDEARREIECQWGGGLLVSVLVALLRMMSLLGFKVINR